MARRYFTLLTREDGRWCPQFGDYDRETVEQEAEDSYSETLRRDRKIIATGETQAARKAAIAKLNAKAN